MSTHTISVRLENKPGALARVSRTLAQRLIPVDGAIARPEVRVFVASVVVQM